MLVLPAEISKACFPIHQVTFQSVKLGIIRSLFASSCSKSCCHLSQVSILMLHECLKRPGYPQDLPHSTLQHLILTSNRTSSSPKQKHAHLASIPYTHSVPLQLRGLAVWYKTRVVFSVRCSYVSCASGSKPAAPSACAPKTLQPIHPMQGECDLFHSFVSVSVHRSIPRIQSWRTPAPVRIFLLCARRPRPWTSTRAGTAAN